MLSFAQLSQRLASIASKILPLFRYVSTLILVALTYLGTGTLAESMATPATPSYAVWWPSGVSLGAMLTFGYRVWPGVAAGCLLFTHFFSPAGIDFRAAFSDVMEALTGAFLARRFLGKSNPLKKVSLLLKYICLAVICAPFVGSTLAFSIGHLTGNWPLGNYKWLAWGLENIIGSLVLSTTILAFFDASLRPHQVRPLRILEAAFLFTGLIAMAEMTFGNWLALTVKRYPLEFLCTPFLVWASLRFGPLCASSAITLLSVICVSGTARGFGPFASTTPFEAVHLVQTYVATNAILSLLTAALTVEREEANASLSRSNLELERFAYLASHDLQEPLRTISTFCTLIERRCRERADSTLNEYLELVVNAAKRMHDLINSLLSYSRVGKKVEIQMVEAEEALDLVLRDLRTSVTEAKAEIRFQKLPAIKADSHLLALLFQNLISNSIKFNTSSPPRVWISATKIREQWQFKVQDNGIGIDAKYFKKIFGLFERLVPSSSRYPGTGLGLAVCKKIVEEHGGRIWVESRVGEGACFYFTFPCNIVEGGRTPSRKMG